MKLSKIKKITKTEKQKCYDITVENNHNFFCNNFLIHNCSYRGEIMVVLINHGSESFKINKGDKIAQLIIEKCESAEFEIVDSLDTTTRNEGGFGSSDKKLIQG